MAFVEVTKKDNIAIVTMNRPEALNALNKAVFADFEAALDQVEFDDDVYVIIITGSGRSFIAGADIGEMAPMNVADGLAFSELGNRVLMRVDMMEKPTIAAVNGFALGGGCEMALACDIRIASEKAKFGQPEVGLGIMPAPAAPSVWPVWSAPARPRSLSSPAASSLQKRPLPSAWSTRSPRTTLRP